jgi:rSAM/selenodomain-associated transferase 1
VKPDRLILFAKATVAGRVKTRLAPLLDAEAATQLHSALVADACEMLMNFGAAADLELCLDAPTESWSEYPFGRTDQGDGGLGERMLRAITRTLNLGYRQAMILGADSPGLPAGHIQELLDADVDAALGPTIDGGYYAIKCRRADPAMFQGVRWSTRETYEDTVYALRRCGLSVATGRQWFDVDEPPDVGALLQVKDLPRHSAAWLNSYAALLREFKS